ncbi:hypothetical protein [Dactylosporangium sp. CS-033363]|uniref:hypothetical protein n=1 Tax=Dactylosporangium sp. CS-033363 TaxID=3239935 RepID=UPI003D928D93
MTVELVLERRTPHRNLLPRRHPRIDPQLKWLMVRFPSTVEWTRLGADRWQGLDHDRTLYRWVRFDPGTGRIAHTHGDRELLDGLPPSPASPAVFAMFRLGRELDAAAAADTPADAAAQALTTEVAGYTCDPARGRT